MKYVFCHVGDVVKPFLGYPIHVDMEVVEVYLVCPLCGKLAHLNSFTPDEYSDDIECVEMRGLGRGKGFEVTSRFSALGDEELMGLISSRCRIILRIVGEEVVAATAAADTERMLGEWKKEALWRREVEEELKDEIDGLQNAADEHEETIDGLLAQVNNALSEVYETFSDVGEAVAALIVEYNEALEEAEDISADAEEY